MDNEQRKILTRIVHIFTNVPVQALLLPIFIWRDQPLVCSVIFCLVFVNIDYLLHLLLIRKKATKTHVFLLHFADYVFCPSVIVAVCFVLECLVGNVNPSNMAFDRIGIVLMVNCLSLCERKLLINKDVKGAQDKSDNE